MSQAQRTNIQKRLLPQVPALPQPEVVVYGALRQRHEHRIEMARERRRVDRADDGDLQRIARHDRGARGDNARLSGRRQFRFKGFVFIVASIEREVSSHNILVYSRSCNNVRWRWDGRC